MKKLFLILLLCYSNTIFASDTLVAFGKNNPLAPTWSYIGGGNNLDAVAWKTDSYTETGWITNTPTAIGFGANPPVRNTFMPEDNTNAGGGVPGARFPTIYFRKQININAANFAAYSNFVLQYQFDDGVIIWVNGVKIETNNVDPLATYATWADSAILNSGAIVVEKYVNKSAFHAGLNTIAVELHQTAAASSDLFFDLQLIGNTPNNFNLRPFTIRYQNESVNGDIVFVANNSMTTQNVFTGSLPPLGTEDNSQGVGVNIDIDNAAPINIFGFNSTWKYFDAGSRPTDWHTTSFDDSAWPSGIGQLGYGDGDENTCIQYGCAPSTCFPANSAGDCFKYITYYFRKVVNIPNVNAYAKFLLNFTRDDGAVVYVNGVEIGRNNMPGGVIDNTTLANVALGGVDENAVISFSTAGTYPFVNGNNVIAVEIHQSNATSSDLTFDLSLLAEPANNTFNSSSADLNLPVNCSEILFAGLYWGASHGFEDNKSWRTPNRDTVLFKVPGQANYETVVSTQTDDINFGIPDASQNHNGYQAFADVTNLLDRFNPNGTYTTANVVAPANLINACAGWTMVVAYRDYSGSITRNLTVFDGVSVVSSANFVDTKIAGFKTPVLGPVSAKFGAVAFDGDRNSQDGFFFKQDSNIAVGSFIDLSNSSNAQSTSGNNDSWNSTISYLNNVVTTRNPAHNNTLGYDADIIQLNNPGNTNLANSQTSAVLRLNSSNEKYYLQVVTSAISVASPAFAGNIASTDVNGGATFAPNEILRYNINFQNQGNDTSVNTYIVDTIPQNLLYQPNSLRIGGVSKTDAPGDDEAEYDPVQHIVRFRIGVGANATQGGQILPAPGAGNSGAVSFETKAINICELLQCYAGVENRALVFYTAKQSEANGFSYIGRAGGGCNAALPMRDTIIGACVFSKDSILTNQCSAANVYLPLAYYPRYTYYRALPFITANEFMPPTTPITTSGIYYATTITENGCGDTVIFRVRIRNCNDIDDDNDGIPDYVETGISIGLLDADSDGTPNWADLDYASRVDYDGDAIDDRFDAAADADNDGIPNYYDRDFTLAGAFTDANNDGVNDIFDKDLDGLINQYDADSDNDGIPDVVESLGVDANGDGVIDNYTDTDNDGFSQNVDANNTGITNSGNGLGYIDFDNDGLPNALDADSDNDGIPDIVEALGNDVNNNAVVDGTFVDVDVDGFFDPVDGDADGAPGAENTANALLKTGADVIAPFGHADGYPFKNFDLDAKPNPYDVDSDGDGILDVREAGFPETGFNGFTSSPYNTNGWSIILAARTNLGNANTDNRGNPNYLDIDADDDGISDNIEGQPTINPLPTSLVYPTGLDADADGLDNAYDNNGSFGGIGIIPVNIDGDPFPDFIDLDTDSDGQIDRVEGNDFNENGIADDDVALTFLDDDGDGLDNKFDAFNGSIKGTSVRVSNGGYTTGDPTPGMRGPVRRKIISNADRDWRFITAVLSIQKVVLNAAVTSSGNQLSWTLVADKTLDHFEIEKSEGSNNNFKLIKNVTGTYLINSAAKFDYLDKTSPKATPTWYRIKAIMQNKSVIESNVVYITPIENNKLVLTPNPTNGNFNATFFAEKAAAATIKIVDVTGKIVNMQTFTVGAGVNTINSTSQAYLAKGVYAVIIVSGQNKWVAQLVKL
jgi:uncharacterized repeat protein (TIGR01451 family)